MQKSKARARNNTTNKRKQKRAEAQRRKIKNDIADFVAASMIYYNESPPVEEMLTAGYKGLRNLAFDELVGHADKYYYMLRDPDVERPNHPNAYNVWQTKDDMHNWLLHYSARVADIVADVILLAQ